MAVGLGGEGAAIHGQDGEEFIIAVAIPALNFYNEPPA